MLTRESPRATNRPAILLALLLVSSVAILPYATAGTAASPEVIDPAGDQSVSEGPLATSAPSFDNIDVLKVWVSENSANASVILNVETTAPFNDGSSQGAFSFDFMIAKGPTSVFGSTANGTAFSIIARSDGTVEGVDNGTVAVVGNVTSVAIPLASLGASGGDLLSELVLEASGLHEGNSALPLDQDDSSAVDRAPNNGTAPDYTFARGPIVAGVSLVVQGDRARTVTDPDASIVFPIRVTNTGSDEDRFTFTGPTVTGATATVAPDEMTLAPGASTLTFLTVDLNGAAAGTVFNLPVTVASDRGASSTVTPSVTVRAIGAEIALKHAGAAERSTQDPFAKLTFSIQIENKGTDFDTITFAAPSVTGAASATVAPATVSLGSGDSTTSTLTVNLNNATSTVTIVLQATSENGANATLTATVKVGGAAAAGGSDGAKFGLDALTPAAEALGFDEMFGEWAEVAVIGLALLVLLILLFLILFLPKRPWLEVEVRPRKLNAEPGEIAEFQVQVRNRKKEFRRAVARLSGRDADWKAGLLLKQEDGGALEPMTSYGDLVFGLTARDEPGDHYEGTLRVQIPEDAAPKSRSTVDLEIIPLDEGDERPRKGGRARVAVKAAKPAEQESPITITEVLHEPDSPEEGDEVTTTAHLTNISDEPWNLEVALLVDDLIVDEQDISLAPGEERKLSFGWRAGAGSNKVRLQVLEAED